MPVWFVATRLGVITFFKVNYNYFSKFSITITITDSYFTQLFNSLPLRAYLTNRLPHAERFRE